MSETSDSRLLRAQASRQVSVSPDAAWAVVAGFGGIAQWHPAVAKCDVHDDGGKTYRTLTLGNGAVLLEKLVANDVGGRSYSYTIEAGPLPVSDYQSTLKVEPQGSGAILHWDGSFRADGVPSAEAIAIITGIYDAGLDSLVERVSK